MVAKKPRVVIIGAGMAGLVAAHKLYKAAASKDVFELCVVEGGNRIGGRICTSEFGGNQIEMGATWIHGIGGSPIYQIARDTGALESKKPWERMDGFPEDPLTVAEDGSEVDASIVDPISNLYKKLMEFAQGKLMEGDDYYDIASKALKSCTSNGAEEAISIGSFLRSGLEAYWADAKQNPKILEEAVFSMHENTERTYTGAGDLVTLDFNAEREYNQFPDEEITIAKGYSSIIQTVASVLPNGLIQLGKKVDRIEWQLHQTSIMQNSGGSRPVKLHFDDGSSMVADHVIVTVSLGVLKAEIQEDSGMFSPPLPSFKTEAISRLGFGVVNKLFLQVNENDHQVFPFLQMAFQQSDSKSKHQKIPWWMRRTTSLCPIHNQSSVVLSWFAGEEALQLESLKDEEIINGVTTTISTFLDPKKANSHNSHDSHIHSNGNGNPVEKSHGFKFTKLLRTQWGSNPLFKGSYSYVAAGSSGKDLDAMAKPLPSISKEGVPPLQILFAGEATHRTHYSTTHGAYFSGIREANRLLQHYQCGGLSELLHH